MTIALESASCLFCSWSYTGADIQEQVRVHRLIHPTGIDAPASPEADWNDDHAGEDPEPSSVPVVWCKVKGCKNEAGPARRGPYARLCDDHRMEMRATVQENAAKGGRALRIPGPAKSDPSRPATSKPPAREDAPGRASTPRAKLQRRQSPRSLEAIRIESGLTVPEIRRILRSVGSSA